MSEVTHELDEFEMRLLGRIEEHGIAGGGLHLYTNVTAKERRLIRKFERVKLVSIDRAWARLTAAGQALINRPDANVVAGSTPDEELIYKILVKLGVNPGDWSISLSGIYAAIRCNMQIGEPHMSKVEDWTDAAEISEDTLTGVMFKLVERAEKAEQAIDRARGYAAFCYSCAKSGEQPKTYEWYLEQLKQS